MGNCGSCAKKRRRYLRAVQAIAPDALEVVPPAPVGRPQIAVDIQILFDAFALVAAAGADVIYEASIGEPDEVWFEAARARGVHAIASPDWDLGVLCVEHRLGWIRMPGQYVDLRGAERQAYVIAGTLRRWGWIP